MNEKLVNAFIEYAEARLDVFDEANTEGADGYFQTPSRKSKQRLEAARTALLVIAKEEDSK